MYPNLVCDACERRAVGEDGDRPKVGSEYLGEESKGVTRKEDGTPVIHMEPNVGENPVFIDGQKCWRRYRFGGHITMRDDHDCDSVTQFYETHRPPADDSSDTSLDEYEPSGR